MIVTNRFVFLHLHKSGGTFVNELLMRFLPDARQVGYHLPWSCVPPSHAHLPVLGFVRNPWSYYVSWYAFQSSRPTPNALFRILSDERRLGFEETIGNMLDLSEPGSRLDALVAALPRAYTNQGLNLPGFALERIRGTGLGFYSFLFRYLFEGAPSRHVGRMETLREDLPGMLAAVGQPVDESMQTFIRTAPARNASTHAPYASYYSRQLRERVAQRDGALIEQFGYVFED